MATTAGRPRPPRTLMVTCVLLSVVGMLLSVYAYHVESSAEADPSYRAFCDISSRISCSKVFTSRWGRGFGLIDRFVDKHSVLNQPNSVFGMVFYLLQASIAFSTGLGLVLCQLVSAVLVAVGCVYLGYILAFVLNDFCLVCISLYVVNAALLVCATMKYNSVKQLQKQKSQKKKR